jgi:hypothetical protein
MGLGPPLRVELTVGAGDPGAGQRVHNYAGWIEGIVLSGVRLKGRHQLAERLAGRAGAAIVRIRGRRLGMMMTMMMVTADCLRHILHVGKLAALRGVRKVGSQLVELSGGCGVAIRLRSLSGVLQVRRDLLRDLLILGRVGLLKLLERAHQLSEGRKAAFIRLQRSRRRVTGLRAVQAGILEGGADDRLQVATGEVVYGTGAHAPLSARSLPL